VRGRKRVKLTVIFTVPPNAQAPGLDSRKTQSNGFAQGRGIDVGYSILVANPSVREIEPLPWDVTIGVRGVVRGEPVKKKTKKKRCEHEASRREKKGDSSQRPKKIRTKLGQKSVWPCQMRW